MLHLVGSLSYLLSNVTYSFHHHQAGVHKRNAQTTFRTATGLCKKVSFAVLFGSKGYSYTVYMELDIRIHTNFLHNTER
jgi:hypothetical protein